MITAFHDGKKGGKKRIKNAETRRIIGLSIATWEREQVFIGKQKDDLDGVAVPTPYLQQYYYTKAMTKMWAFQTHF